MEKQLTALAQSIARKKERVKELKQERSEIYPNSRGTGKTFAYGIDMRIDELTDQITEDEKLLSVEMDDIIRSYRAGEEGIHLFAGTYFNKTFKND